MSTKRRNVFFAVMGLLLCLSLALESNVFATNITDVYMGADNNGYGDVIGNTGDFQISSMVATLSNTTLHVTINTAFGGKGDNGLFSGLTYGQGIGYGDLFLSNVWNPNGNLADHYINDNAATGTQWTHAVSLGGTGNWGDGTNMQDATLYQLSPDANNLNAKMSDDFLSGGTFRNGQEVMVDKTKVGNIALSSNLASWQSPNGGNKVEFWVDLSNTTLLSGTEIGLHWAMSCANDVIEGSFSLPAAPVPEPATLALFGIGLAGITGSTVRRRLKK